ncbi:MAG: CPBP family intramembrane metalloprotease [Bacillota bacterium]|nr:CPBP family intramembrane metalloprotease [Bacillota bacterium]
MKGIFVNKNSQVRSGWKITATLATFFAVTLVTAILFQLIFILYLAAAKHMSLHDISVYGKTSLSIDSAFRTIGNILQCSSMIFSVVLFWKVFDKKPIRYIGFINLKHGYKDLLKGLLLGAISLTAVFAILLATGHITMLNPFSKPNFNMSLLNGLILFIFVGINEEMFARGYCMTVLKQTGNKWVPAIVSAIIFALMHSMNSGISIFSYVNLFLFGLFTAYMFIRSGNLWLSIGYHITWNYFEGNVFGFLVSGQEANGIYNVKNKVDNIITGGSFGPEGGLVVTFIIAVGFIYLWKFYKPSMSNNSAKDNTIITEL